MSTGMSRFPDPYQSRTDLSHATVFLIVVMLIIAIGAILYFGNAWVFAPIDVSSINSLTTAAGAKAPTGPATPAAQPTFTAPTPVPPLAGVAFQAKPSVTATPGKPGEPAPTPLQTPGPPTPAATGSATVANTGGDGVYLRRTPHLADRWIAWPDTTVLQLTGAEADGDGQHWLQVRDPKGDVGWVPAQYVRR